MGRTVISKLLEKELMTSEGSKMPLRLALSLDLVERWFPRLYPVV